MSELTRLLNNAAGGDTVSLNQLYDLVFAQLRAIAAHKMASERPGHTLQPTALVIKPTFGSEALRVSSLKTGRTSSPQPPKRCAGSSWTMPAVIANSSAAATRNEWSFAKPEP